MTRSDQKILPVGKLPIEHLRSLLADVPGRDLRLLIGPQIGEDAAVIDAGDRYLVVTTDPITVGCLVDRGRIRRNGFRAQRDSGHRRAGVSHW